MFVHFLLTCLLGSVWFRCLASAVLPWPTQQSYDAEFNHMTISANGKHLFVSGKDSIYHLNSSSMTLLEKTDLVKGEVGFMTTISASPGTEDLIVCRSNNDDCRARSVLNISESKDYKQIVHPVRKPTVEALFANFEYRTQKNDYWFIACPHDKAVCERGAGIFWKTTDEATPLNSVIFKPETEYPNIKTERYVSSFSIDQFRLFFSVQSKSKVLYSRISQICQHKSQRSHDDTTKLTYIDMRVECGFYRIITNAKTVTVGNEQVIIATFVNEGNSASAVCVFKFSDIRSRFLENLKECYNGNKPTEDYMKVSNRCVRESSLPFSDKIGNAAEENKLLCNDEALKTYHSVVGTITLHHKPVEKFKGHVISSVTLATKGQEVIGFFGTNNGQLLKAVVYPVNDNRTLQSDVHFPGEAINQDSYTDTENSYIYALTKTKVYKIPVEMCSQLSTCSDCLGDRDPYCGWCMLENRCSSSSNCTTTWLASTASVGTCPEITWIKPDTFSVQDKQIIQLHPSQAIPMGTALSCLFHSDQPDLMFTVQEQATIKDNNILQCDAPYLSMNNVDIEKMTGYLDVSVSVMSSLFNTSIMSSTVTYFYCQSFKSCGSCIKSRWECDWCIYGNQCISGGTGCGGVNNSTVYEFVGPDPSTCPTVTQYTGGLRDDNNTLYMAQDEDYTISLTGSYLPQPQDGIDYKCNMRTDDHMSVVIDTTWVPASNTVTCHVKKGVYNMTEGNYSSTLTLIWGDDNNTLPVDGVTQSVILYSCGEIITPSNNCGKCKSFAHDQPWYKCHWCNNKCVHMGNTCADVGNNVCPNPIITSVYPLSVHVNATTIIDIYGVNLGSHYNESIDAVTIDNLPCVSIQEAYIPSEKICCKLGPSENKTVGSVVVTLKNRQPVTFSKLFAFKIPTLMSISPSIGPLSGGTNLTVSGEDLDTGREVKVTLEHADIEVNCITLEMTNSSVVCKTDSCPRVNMSLDVVMEFDGAKVRSTNVTYQYRADPVVLGITPRHSFKMGGRTITVTGTNLHVIQKPKVFAIFPNGSRSNSSECWGVRSGEDYTVHCPTPNMKIPNKTRRKKRELQITSLRLGFEMDNVSSVQDLPNSIASMNYYNNPQFTKFTENEKYHKVLVIQGQGLGYAAALEDYTVWIGESRCNISTMNNETLTCNPPPTPGKHKKYNYHIKVEIYGNKEHYFPIGYMEYDNEAEKLTDNANRQTEYTVAGVVVGVLILGILILVVALIVTQKKRQKSNQEKESLEYKMDRYEISMVTQCREEFASLHTTVSDLTSDLEGGNVLFRDYDEYTCRTMFPSGESDPLISPSPDMTDKLSQSIEPLRGLLRNQQFLLMLIRTLEKEKTFNIRDKSNVATILMILNDDNIEYITGIMKILMNDLVDKNIAASTPKLLLRRSESVCEKLLTHWLSVCLYHTLKERSGSALYILYKAIKIQIEKGPVDYITGCAKYTLSEDKIFTSTDTDCKTLNLHVVHLNYLDNEEKSVTVPVLDCDTITQVKVKMLEILYKNVPYSQRPTVHSTSLEVCEDDGTKRVLHDEDASSLKEGLWKRINTLLHYNIHDDTHVRLAFNRENVMANKLTPAGASPDTFILSNSSKRTKQVVRTVSGSNFWHLTKQHHGDEDDLTLVKDIFIHGLTNTKGILQKYIDDLFTEILKVGDEPPLIIKYLYDFLDSVAVRCGITDPDVIHTWKCNSLLLRFWVNILKNPEFVFDIHKPNIVDSCLSVIAQTLMDSCSTADIKLTSLSPTNKILFAKDIPRYKGMVIDFFSDMKNKPAVSDQELNSFLTEKVSRKFSGKFHQSSAILAMYKYVARYRNQIFQEMDNQEAESPGSFSPLTSKLELVFMSMDMPSMDVPGK